MFVNKCDLMFSFLPAMSFIAEGHDTTYRFNLKEVTRMLKTKHGDKYLVRLVKIPLFI